MIQGNQQQAGTKTQQVESLEFEDAVSVSGSGGATLLQSIILLGSY
jgi:hypothetical protein